MKLDQILSGVRYAIGPLAALMLVLALQLGRATPVVAVDFTTGLLTTNRSALRVCVDNGTDQTGPVAGHAENVRRGLDRLKGHARFTTSGYDRAPVVVDAGCPANGALQASGQPHLKNGGSPVSYAVAVPSQYRVMVFVTTSAEISRMFGTARFPMSTQEELCFDRDCFEVTTALYVTRDQLGTTALDGGLRKALGLEPVQTPVDPHLPKTRP